MKKRIINLYPLLQGKSRKVAWAVVPSVALILMAFVISGCVKQKDCDCGETGTFIYLESPYKPSNNTGCGKSEKIVAYFTSYDNNKKAITGYIPLSFRVHDTLNVRVCTKDICEGQIMPAYAYFTTLYSLKCIERE
jgi:hypothetical protein